MDASGLLVDTTSNVRTRARRLTGPRWPRRIVTLVSAILVGITATLAFATAAEAAPVCGAWKTVRTSLHYRACNAIVSGSFRTYDVFQNDHGSTVWISVREGFSLNGSSVFWYGNGQPYGYEIAPGRSQVVGDQACFGGQSLRYAVQGQQSNGSWGAISYATAVRCP